MLWYCQSSSKCLQETLQSLRYEVCFVVQKLVCVTLPSRLCCIECNIVLTMLWDLTVLKLLNYNRKIIPMICCTKSTVEYKYQVTSYALNFILGKKVPILVIQMKNLYQHILFETLLQVSLCMLHIEINSSSTNICTTSKYHGVHFHITFQIMSFSHATMPTCWC